MNEAKRDLETARSVTAPAQVLEGVLTDIGLADRYFSLDTPIGAVFVAHNARGISAVSRADDAEAFRIFFEVNFGRRAFLTAEPGDNLRSKLQRRLIGGHEHLDYDLRGLSEFEQAVLRKALEIPRGEIRPYAWVAREIGRPRAVRAVGSSLARNPVPLFIPCHRVVRSDGKIGNYGLGGPANKQALLSWEGLDPDEVERLAREGVRYLGSETTKIFCFPSCRHARRISLRHRLRFHTSEQARAAGYRPCETCRPWAEAV